MFDAKKAPEVKNDDLEEEKKPDSQHVITDTPMEEYFG